MIVNYEQLLRAFLSSSIACVSSMRTNGASKNRDWSNQNGDDFPQEQTWYVTLVPMVCIPMVCIPMVCITMVCIPIRCLMVSTNLADPSCFYFRIS